MTLTPNPTVMEVLAKFDIRTDAFEVNDVSHALLAASKDLGKVPEEARLAWWAEWAAMSFDVRERPDNGPWNTYFQPVMTLERKDGTAEYRPDLRDANADVIAYWAERANAAKHPVLIARYSDLVWDATEFVTKTKRGRDTFEYLTRAIDNYIAASRIDDGSAWSDTHFNLGRALELAISVKDTARTAEVVNATFEYVNRTADDDKIGTYCYLFDNLLPPNKGPQLTEEQERDIITRFETKFTEITTPGGQWDVDPHRARDIGTRLAAYYQRRGSKDDRIRVLRGIAQAFERRAKIGDALTGVFFLDDARDIYVEAGLRDDADRVQLESQRMHPEAAKQMAPITVKQEIKQTEIDVFLSKLTEGGLEQSLIRLVVNFVPDQQELAKHIEQRDEESPIQAIFAPKLMDSAHLTADIGDETGDPDGRMVYETSLFCQFRTPWIAWAFDHLIKGGLNGAQVVAFVRQSALFTDDRIALVQRGVDAHVEGDFALAIHFLIPQIERALVNLLPHVGKPSNKQHRAGRGVMQFKNLNDLLTKEGWPVPGENGENLRLYLLAALAHPKGMNIRNEICHGLWPTERFTKAASERVLHVLLAVSMLRPAENHETPPTDVSGSAQ